MQNVLIHGPQASGKTTNSELLREHFGCDAVVELEAGRLPDMKLLAHKHGKYARLLFLCTPETLNLLTRVGVTEILWKLKVDTIVSFYRAIALASKQRGDDVDREERIETLLFDIESRYGPSAPRIYHFVNTIHTRSVPDLNIHKWAAVHGDHYCESEDLHTAVLDLSAKVTGTFSRPKV